MKWRVLCAVVCLQLGLSAAQTPVNPPITGICGLDGYDLTTLYKKETGWDVTVSRTQNCIVPEGMTQSDVSSCKIYFSICRPLPSNICDGVAGNASVCQEVTLSNTSVVYYNMGSYNRTQKFKPSAASDVDGFYGAYNGDSITSTRCNGTLTSIFTYKCNINAKWSSQDVTEYSQSQTNPESACEYFIFMDYDGACYIPPTIAPAHCQLDEYKIPFIANVSTWMIKADPSTCVGEDETSCTILVAFCHPIPPSNGAYCYGSAVCQIAERGNNDAVEYSMGDFENYTRFYENDQNVDGGFHMDVSNGTAVGDCVEGLNTRVILVCNGSATWNNQTTEITEHAKIAYDAKLGPCEYTLTVQYSGACITVSPVVSGARDSPVGWILMGIFALAVVSYLVVGAAVQYFVRRKRGPEILPNYDFWKAFVLYTLEGCKFTLDAITCFKFEGRMPSRKVDYDKI